MKLNAENGKKLNAVRKAVMLGMPITGMMIAAGCSDSTPDKGPAKQETILIKIETETETETEPMNPFMLSGVPPPTSLEVQLQKYKVKAEDTWESLAAQYGTSVEIMLRINRIPKKTVRQVVDSNVIPEKLKLVQGQEIYIPEKMEWQ